MISPNSTNEMIVSYIKPIKNRIHYSHPEVDLDLLVKRIKNFQNDLNIEDTRYISLIQFDLLKTNILYDSMCYHYENSCSILIACLSSIIEILMHKTYTLKEKKHNFDIIIQLMISELTIES